jgi:pimeloyl-ACP methyl ester carboxylesterase
MRAPLLLILALLLVFTGGCRRMPVTDVTTLKAADPDELQRYLLSSKPDVATFRHRGPFAVAERRGISIPLPSGTTIEADLFLCEKAGKAPLVIILHGYENLKEDHTFQALHVASWCMHGMTLQLPSRGPWITNGRTLAQVVAEIRRTPRLVEDRVDLDRIVLAGHSFGATAVATALGEGAPAAGGVLLDPAGIGRGLPDLLRRIRVPVMLIGADEEIWPTRNRGYFYRFIPGNVGEISIRDATHEDAQYPSERTLRLFEDNPLATEDAQIAFVSALTAAAFALSTTGGIDYAWNSFGEAFKSGLFFNARRK